MLWWTTFVPICAGRDVCILHGVVSVLA